MAWQVSKRVWDHIKTDKDIKQGERLILLALADIADENGICWPKFDTSYQTLSDMAGVNRRSAMRIVDDLCKTQHLIKVDAKGRGHSNIYAVTTGLTDPEKGSVLSLIGVTHNTISNEEGEQNQREIVLPATPIKKEMVLPITPGGVTHNTIYDLNGVTHNTHPIMSPSYSSVEEEKNQQPPTPGNKKPATLDQLMFLKISELCQWEIKLMSEKQKGRVKNTKNRLLKFGTDPPRLDDFSEWWFVNDWRGQKGQPPTPEQILEEWGKFIKATEKPKVRMSAK